MQISEQPSFCVLPWVSISVDGPGRSRLCCNNSGHWHDHSQPTMPAITEPLAALNTDLHKAVRRSMSAGERHQSCGKCWQIEDTGGTSFRQIWNSVFADRELGPVTADGTLLSADIHYLDITFGNKCNLVCRMCNWANSHLWTADNLKLGRAEPQDNSRMVRQLWFEDPRAMQTILATLPTVTHINFLGGEPLIITQHEQILEACVVQGHSQHIHISYNTNLTRLSHRLLELWQQFAHVTVNVSLEAVGRANDYIRQNSHWSEIMRNLRQVERLAKHSHQIRLDIHTTFGIYNCLSVAELITWCRSRLLQLPFVNIVYHPNHHDVRLLPLSAKAQIRHEIAAAITGMEQHHNHASWLAALNYMDQDGDAVQRNSLPGWPSDPWLQFWHDATEIDQLKNRHMREYLPRLWELRP